MKKIIFVCILAFFACEEEPESDIGCMTGIPKSGGTDRVLIRCCTHKQYLAGNNVNAGGIASSINYTNHKWEKCPDCN